MKISPNLEKELLTKAAEGWSARRISDWLAKDRKIKVTPQAINARLRQTRVERSEVAKAVTREALVPQVVNDLEILGKEQSRVEKLSGRLHARAHAALDTLDQAAAGELTEEDGERVKLAVLTSESMSELALKASDRVKAIADRKLHYAGADADEGAAPDFRSMTDDQLAEFAGTVFTEGTRRRRD